ncbi:MAG: Chemotaxis histidine kinase CheA [uncultured bacterium]|nr:MAG: Chemotaxis histidine kinase CheA [uncultured bacterium]HBR71421.1 response regulator [Candidatus Moranbacteria bacterium]
MTNENIKIIFAEDDDLTREMYSVKFHIDGFDIVSVRSGKEALKSIENRIPDVIVSDIVMPDGDGLFLLEKVKDKSETKKIPFIVLTNLFSDEDKKEALALGADEYLVKADTTPKNLVEKVKNIIKNK